MLLTIAFSQDDLLQPVTAEEKMQLLTAKVSSLAVGDIVMLIQHTDIMQLNLLNRKMWRLKLRATN